MLWQRIATALVLIPLVVAGLLLLDTAKVAIVFGLVLLLGAAEMARLAGLTKILPIAVYVAVVGVLLWLAWDLLVPQLRTSMQWIIATWWVLITVALVARRRDLERIGGRRPAILLLGALVLASAWASVIGLHGVAGRGPALVLFLFLLIWVADSGAYFAGRAFGRRKLSPFVSPGKTWAGVAGAMLGSLVCALGLSWTAWSGSAGLPALAALCVVVTAVSIGGDLWESRLNREAGVKDSGTLIPGHGGVLDRIDSLLAAAPVFALGAGLIGVTG